MNASWIYRRPPDMRAGVALLFLRVVTGVAFILHGWSKIQQPFGWMGADAGMPAIVQALIALAEFGGGIALIVGLLTPIAALGIACVMLGAVFVVHVPKGDPFVGGYELALVYLAVALVLMLLGPGVLALDRLLFGRRL